MPSPGLVETRNAIFYFASIVINMFFFVMAIAYIMLTISVNAGRISDLSLIKSNLQASSKELTQNRTPEDFIAIRNAILDNSSKLAKQKKDIDFGDERFHAMTFRQCALAFDANCFHRNSSWMNNIYLGMACGILGACLSFFVLLRTDAVTDSPTMWRLSTLISLICLIPIGSIVGLLTLFLLRGANGTVLTQVSGVVQVESPFGIAFACTLAALFSDRVLSALSRLLDHIGVTKAPQAAGV